MQQRNIHTTYIPYDDAGRALLSAVQLLVTDPTKRTRRARFKRIEKALRSLQLPDLPMRIDTISLGVDNNGNPYIIVGGLSE